MFYLVCMNCTGVIDFFLLCDLRSVSCRLVPPIWPGPLWHINNRLSRDEIMTILKKGENYWNYFCHAATDSVMPWQNSCRMLMNFMGLAFNGTEQLHKIFKRKLAWNMAARFHVTGHVSSVDVVHKFPILAPEHHILMFTLITYTHLISWRSCVSS